MNERDRVDQEIFDIKNNYPLAIDIMMAFSEVETFTVEEALKCLEGRSSGPHTCGCGKEHKENLVLVHPEMIRYLLKNLKNEQTRTHAVDDY